MQSCPRMVQNDLHPHRRSTGMNHLLARVNPINLGLSPIIFTKQECQFLHCYDGRAICF